MRWQQAADWLRANRWAAAGAGCVAAANVCYYGLHATASWYRAFSASCTEEGTQEMLLAEEATLRLVSRAAEGVGVDARVGGDAAGSRRLIVFTCRGHDPVGFGRLGSRLGAYLGLPDFLQHQHHQQQQQRQALYFMDRLLSLNTKRGRQLYEECLQLTEQERLFAVARQLAYLDSGFVHSLPTVGTLAAAGCAANLHWLFSDKGQLLLRQVTRRYGGSRVLRPLLIGITALLWSFMAHQWYAAYCKTLDASSDARAASAFPDGAVSYYEKMIKRNMLLRGLLGDEIGDKYFTVKGNEKKNWLLSEPFLPVNQRCSKLRHSLQRQQQQQQQLLS